MFWDSSALIPYLVPEAWSRESATALSADPSPAIWWATPVECFSALERKRREGSLTATRHEEARRRSLDLWGRLCVVEPSLVVRDRAVRLLASHAIRASDALHLAAALLLVEERTQGQSFVCLDDRLRSAAAAEGFTLVPATTGSAPGP